MTELLFSPTTLSGLSLRNRVAMAPLTRQRADAQGIPQCKRSRTTTLRCVGRFVPDVVYGGGRRDGG